MSEFTITILAGVFVLILVHSTFKALLNKVFEIERINNKLLAELNWHRAKNGYGPTFLHSVIIEPECGHPNEGDNKNTDDDDYELDGEIWRLDDD